MQDFQYSKKSALFHVGNAFWSFATEFKNNFVHKMTPHDGTYI